MKKTNYIILGVLVGLIIVIIIIYNSGKDTEQRVLRDFFIEDTASINKIFLVDKRNQEITLKRQNGYWTVNDRYRARRDLVNLLLETFRRMEISSPVPKEKYDYVLRSISVKGIKCEIYQNNRLSKTYYVGGVTQDNTGTYMIMENSDVPFVVHIPGFSGYLTVRYNTFINEWRERIVFNYHVNDIHKIYVEYPDNLNESFIAINNGNNQFDLKTINNQNVTFPFDTIKVKEFISRCKFIGFEAYIKEEIQKKIIDSLKNEPVVSKFTIEDFNGEKKSMKTYYRQNIEQAFDDEGILYDFDLERLYAVIQGGEEVVLIQYYIIDPISFKKSFFRAKNIEQAMLIKSDF